MPAILNVLLFIVLYFVLSSPNEITNPADSHAIALFQRIFRLAPPSDVPSKREALGLVLFRFSDIQLFNGNAVLIAALAFRNQFAVFHWRIIIYLGWLSSITHLVSLTVLRHHLTQHPQLRPLRLSLMLSNAVMLVVALAPTGRWAWYECPACPVVPCFFGPNTSDVPFEGVHGLGWRKKSVPVMALQVGFLVIYYTSRISQLAKDNTENKPQQTTNPRQPRQGCLRVLSVIYILLRAARRAICMAAALWQGCLGAIEDRLQRRVKLADSEGSRHRFTRIRYRCWVGLSGLVRALFVASTSILWEVSYRSK